MPEFYESEYNQYYEEAMFPNDELKKFAPDMIYIHTTHKNISVYPSLTENEGKIENMLGEEEAKYTAMSAANLRTASTLKGYSLDHLQKVSLSVADQKMGWYHSPTGTLPAENVRCLNDLLAYIRQNNLNVLFLIPPMHFSAADSARLAAAVQLIKSRGCKIYDANDHYAGMGIDFTTDYRNPHHMRKPHR